MALTMTEAQFEAHQRRVKGARVVKLGISDPQPTRIRKPKEGKQSFVVPSFTESLPAGRKSPRTWGYERMLAAQLETAGITGYEREYRWLEGRKYRADLAFPKIRLLVEIDGEAHRIKGRFHSDIKKSQAALLAGWRLLRVSTGQVRDGSACELVRRVMVAK